MKGIFLAALLFLSGPAAAQLTVSPDPLQGYPFAGEAARLRIPLVSGADTAACNRINAVIHEYSFLKDTWLWNDIFDSSLTRIADSFQHCHYGVMVSNPRLLVISLESEFWFEPFPQHQVLWFDVQSGQQLDPWTMLSAAGQRALRDSAAKALKMFLRREPSRVLRRECRLMCRPDSVHTDISAVWPDPRGLNIMYRCNCLASCEFQGPDSVWHWDQHLLKDLLKPAWVDAWLPLVE